jgi:hypothetical protein
MCQDQFAASYILSTTSPLHGVRFSVLDHFSDTCDTPASLQNTCYASRAHRAIDTILLLPCCTPTDLHVWTSFTCTPSTGYRSMECALFSATAFQCWPRNMSDMHLAPEQTKIISLPCYTITFPRPIP